jgi:hypothetical protein
MTLMIELTAELEKRLKDEADRRGVEPEQFALNLIELQLESQAVSPSNSLSRLFAEWDAQDTTTDPEEIVRRQQEWEELKRSLNANHGSYREPIR